VLLVNY